MEFTVSMTIHFPSCEKSILKTGPSGMSHNEIGSIDSTSYHHNPIPVATAKYVLSGKSLTSLTFPLPNLAIMPFGIAQLSPVGSLASTFNSAGFLLIVDLSV